MITIYYNFLTFFKKDFKKYLFIYLAAPVLICDMWDLRCGLQDL